MFAERVTPVSGDITPSKDADPDNNDSQIEDEPTAATAIVEADRGGFQSMQLRVLAAKLCPSRRNYPKC